MVNNNNFPEVEWSVSRLYVRGPLRKFYEETRGNPLKLLTYTEAEIRYGIDPYAILRPQSRDFEFVTDRVERNGKSNIPPGHVYIKAGRFYVGYPREHAALEIGREELTEIGIDERLIDYQNSLPVGNGFFALRLLTTPFQELLKP